MKDHRAKTASVVAGVLWASSLATWGVAAHLEALHVSNLALILCGGAVTASVWNYSIRIHRCVRAVLMTVQPAPLRRPEGEVGGKVIPLRSGDRRCRRHGVLSEAKRPATRVRSDGPSR